MSYLPNGYDYEFVYEMSTLLVIAGLIGLWIAVCVIVLAACWAARRGDEAMARERSSHQDVLALRRRQS
jgi:hypothetical protein